MLFSFEKIKRYLSVVVLLPLAFLMTHCAEGFDTPPVPTAAEDVVSGLASPFDLALVPDATETASGGSLAHNDLLVANFGDNTITRINKATTPATASTYIASTVDPSLKEPSGVAFHPNGDIYVSNFKDADGITTGGSITVFNADGTIDRVINDPLFNGARGIVVDPESTVGDATFFVSNLEDSRILKVTVVGAVDTVILHADLDFLGLLGENPTQLAISPIHPHNIYAANTGLTAGDPLGATLSIIPRTGTGGLGAVLNSDIRLILAGEVNGPLPLGFDSGGNLFTADHENGLLVRIDPQIGQRLGSVETGEANMYGMAVGADDIYLTAVAGGRIIEIHKNLLTGGGGGGGGHHP